MKIQIAKRDLQPAINVVSHTMDEKSEGISSHYCFRPLDDKRLEVLSYGGRIFSSCPAVAKVVEGEFKPFTLSAKRMGLILESIADDTVLEISTGSKGEIIVGVPRGQTTLASLDATTFPYWDAALKAAERTATIGAERLSDALSHAAVFVYDDETKNPGVCVAEFEGGCLFSTDTKAVSVVKVPGMEKSKARIFGADLRSVTTFLASFKEKAPVPEAVEAKVESKDGEKDGEKAPKKVALPPPEVEVFEGERAMFLRRKDGAVFGETRFEKPFPKIQVDWSLEDEYKVEVKKAEVISGIKFLMAGADFNDTALFFDLQDSKIRLSMKSAANAKLFGVDLPIEKVTKKDKAADLPDGGFRFSNVYLSRLLDTCSESNVTFLITRMKSTGWVRVKDLRKDSADHEDLYLTTVVWKKDA